MLVTIRDVCTLTSRISLSPPLLSFLSAMTMSRMIILQQSVKNKKKKKGLLHRNKKNYVGSSSNLRSSSEGEYFIFSPSCNTERSIYQRRLNESINFLNDAHRNESFVSSELARPGPARPTGTRTSSHQCLSPRPSLSTIVLLRNFKVSQKSPS